jgi:transcriptional regulator with XRE-family HTH domain
MDREDAATAAGGSRLAVGSQIRRWRNVRERTLAQVAAQSGLNVGYLSQIENDKASPSLAVLGRIADALDVPAAWFLMGDVPPPTVVRAAERPVVASELGRIEYVDGRASRDVTIVEGIARPGGRVGMHVHPGDEHHLVLRGRFRMTQGEHTVELGPGDYLRWDGSVPHDAEVIGDEEAALLIVRIRPRDRGAGRSIAS